MTGRVRTQAHCTSNDRAGAGWGFLAEFLLDTDYGGDLSDGGTLGRLLQAIKPTAACNLGAKCSGRPG